jgi:hypothetical protein
MGCDAHPIVEVYDENQGIWVAKQSERFQDYNDCPEPVRYLGGRSYTRFAILGDVRNSYREGVVIPLFPGRGMPEDASKDTKEELDVAWAGDIHSLTYFTLAELMAVDWDKVGCDAWHVEVFGDDYQYFLEHGKLPPEWKETWGGDRKKVSEAEMQLMLIGGVGAATTGPPSNPRKSCAWGKTVKHGPVVEIVVKGTYYQLCDSLKDFLIPELQKFGKPEHVRVVMGFDN